jgi:hypothetical protein
MKEIVKLHRKKWCINCHKKRMKGVFVPFEEKFKEGYEIGKVFCVKCGGELI